jgi:hypothetical protein
MKRKKPAKPDELQFCTELIVRLYRDLAARCVIPASSQLQDCKTLKQRSASEGMSFLTKTLPSLGKCLDKALASDCPFPEPVGFALRKNSRFPKFLGDFWDLIFNAEGLVAQPCADEWGHSIEGDHILHHDWRRNTQAVYERTHKQLEAVRAVRQICYLLYKLEGAHSKDSELATIRQFIQTDGLLPEPDAELSITATTACALENAKLIVHRVLCGNRGENLDLHNITPGHGPGAVATGEAAWEKMKFSRYYECLDEVYPYSDYFFFNYTHLVDHLEDLEGLTTLQHGSAKVCLVPKDSRGPRLISMEPLEFQWIQQGQLRALVHHLERQEHTAGFVNFTNQEINRGLALSQSCSTMDDFVTVDMKEASDRVSCWLVNQLFPEHILKCLYACRSSHTMLPSGELLRLKKFAPMGSAVCFPIEALTFWALAVGSLRHIRVASDFESLPPVYVYGDDLIIRKGDLGLIQPVFEELFLEFNKDKCCTGRFFRESCGMDAFKGECVTPTRIKASWVDRSLPAALSYISYSNHLYVKGLISSADYLRGQITARWGQVPVINKAEAWPYAFVDDRLADDEVVKGLRAHFKFRYNPKLMREEVRIPNPRPLIIKRGDPDWGEMLRLKRLGSFPDPFGFDEQRLAPCEHAVPRRLKARWAWLDIHSLVSGEES